MFSQYIMRMIREDDINAYLGNFVRELVDIHDSALLLENFSTAEVNELLEFVTCA